MDPMVAEVIIDISHGDVDRVFDYSVPPELREKIETGCKVQIPFGHGVRSGFVWRLKTKSDIGKIKPLSRVLGKPLLNSVQLKLVQWLVDNYFCFHITALEAVVPPEITREEVPKAPRVYALKKESPLNWGQAKKQKEVWEYLLSVSHTPSKREIMKEVSTSSSTIKAMEKKGLIEVKKEISSKDPLAPRPGKAMSTGFSKLHLAEGEQNSAGKIVYRFDPGENIYPFYFSLVESFLSRKKSVIILVPESGQADLVARMLLKYFPEETVVLHSDLSPQERYHQWWKCREDKPRVLVGTRSAVFAPIRDLGLLILHQEEDDAFRQQENPRYITSEVAEERIRLEGGKLVLSSSSPSINSFYACQKKEFSLKESPGTGKNKPVVKLVDMREEFTKGNISIFSEEVKSTLSELKRDVGNRVFFYVNRRGYAPFILCRSCGYVYRCQNCGRTMTLHKESNLLTCHNCKKKQKPEQTCPRCESKYIRGLGVGTERVAEEIEKLFPDIQQVILDSDRVKTPADFFQISSDIQEGKYQIVIGTRLILKDFFPVFDHGVMVMADTHLNLPFFDSQEELFHLVNASSRRVKNGNLLVQTYNPESSTLQLAAGNEWKEFMEKELRFRKEFNYPPVGHYLVFILSGHPEKKVAHNARRLARMVAMLAREGDIEMMGPVPAYIRQEKGKYFWQVSCRGPNRGVIGRIVRKTRPTIRELIRGGIGVNLELNPKGML